MNRFIYFLGLLGVMAVSCVDEQQTAEPVISDDPVFYASIERSDAPETRVFANDQLRVRWDSGDHISVFNKSTCNRKYAFQGQTGDNSGSFKKVPSEDFYTGNPLDYVYAVYPYSESTSISDDGQITITLPAEQSYRENSFGIGANTMIAVADDNDLMFKNLCGYLMLRLYGEDVAVTSISLKGNNNEPLAGKATVVASSDDVPALSFDASASNEILLTFDTPITLGATAETATAFWLVVPPTTFEDGFTLTVSDINNYVFEKKTASGFEINRSKLERMATLLVVPAVPEPSDEAIVFADPSAKYACVMKYDTNGDGEVSFKEAAAATSFHGLFTNWTKYVPWLSPLDSYKEKNEFALASSGAVDMNTSVKWAAYNLGATEPEEYGGYYAWGETQTKTGYNWNTYKWCNGASNKLTKYCPVDKTDYWDGDGVPDGKTALDLEDDAARVNWGEAWRLPTRNEWKELIEGCLWEWTTYKGINGCMVYCFENARRIFLPAAGFRDDNNLEYLGSYAYYSSSSLNTDKPRRAYQLFFSNSTTVYVRSEDRYYGESIRPVYEE